MINSLVKNLKENGQDFELYPTSSVMLDCIKNRLEELAKVNYRISRKSLLDIGCGTGKVLEYFKNSFTNLYAIEKSQILISQLDADFMILGVDFHKTTLIDKEFDVVFCNPPYSEFEEWASRIIKESPNKSLIYLIIPERWKNSKIIQDALSLRRHELNILDNFTFENAEDRKARAKVDILEIKFLHEQINPFDIFFDENFSYPEESKIKTPLDQKIAETKLVTGQNLIEILCKLYDDRVEELYNNIQYVCKLDYNLLKEFAISRKSLVESLKLKISNCKKEYWQRLFDGMKEINHRLTYSSRSKIVDKMNSQTGVEFNRDNCYTVILHLLKNCNKFFDDQFIEIYEKMINFANVENYKSNQRVFTEDSFQYYNYYQNPELKPEKIKLKVGNRIVLENCGGISNGYYAIKKGITETTAKFIGDLMTIGNNFGFIPLSEYPKEGAWNDSEARNFYCSYKNEEQILFSIRAYKNGNCHIKFLPEFVHTMNIRFGFLKKWIHTPEEAQEETDAPKEIAENMNEIQFKLGKEQLLLM